MEGKPDGRIVPGVILVVLGAVLLAAQWIPGLGGEVIVAGLGVAFLALYGYTRNYGFLVPGGILTGLGLGILAETRLSLGGVELVVLGLGLGFLLVAVVDALFTHASNWWPLIPGGILVAVAVAPAVPQLGPAAEKLWPLALVVAGAVLIVLALRRRSEG